MQSKNGRNVKCGHSDGHMSEVLNSEEAFSVGAGKADLPFEFRWCGSVYLSLHIH